VKTLIAIGEMILLGVRNLLGYKLRTFLTMLGIIIGVAAVIAMLAFGAGAQAQILAQYGRLGIKNVIINAVKPPESNSAESSRSWVYSYGLKFRDEEQIRNTVPGLTRIFPVHAKKDFAWVGGRKAAVNLLGVRPGHLKFLNYTIVDGRSFSAADEIRRRRVAIVRSSLARELGYFGDLLDLEIRVGDDYFRVVGVLDDSEFATPAQKALGLDQKSFEVYVPYETILERRGTLSVQRGSGTFEATDVELTQIIAEAGDERQVLASARMIKRVLDRFHEEPDFEIVVPLELLAQKQAAQRTFNLILILIASISLLVGGIGIANIMLATITERTREIGVRRALGAKRRAIVSQFLTETVAIAAIGGVIGVGLGIGLVLIVAPAAGWPAIVTAYSVVLSFGISVAVGVLFGIFPAMRAARMDPIQALRYE